jgi:hypothetical protein
MTITINGSGDINATGNDIELNSTGTTDVTLAVGGGNVGIGTASPYTQLEISSTDPIVRFNDSNGGTDTKNFELRYVGTNSPDVDGLYFRTVNDANTVYSDKLAILGDGNVGIGTSSPTGSGQILHLNGSSTVADFHMTNSFSGSTASDGFVLRYSGASAEFLNREAGDLIFYTSGTSRMKIDDLGRFFVPNVYSSTTSGAANVNVASSGRLERSTSSLRYKNTINDATHGLTELLTLRPVTFKGNNDGDTVFGGLIAEEVHDAGLTEFVQYDEEDRPDALAYGNMVSLCIKAIQELNTKVEALEAENADMLARIEALETPNP